MVISYLARNTQKKKKRERESNPNFQNINKNETYIINNQLLPWIWEEGWNT